MTKTSQKRVEQKRKIAEMLGGKCSECGYSKNAAALDFHHVGEKEAVIGDLINFHKFSQAVEEAKKCVLLCKNCHAERHNPNLELEYTDEGIFYKSEALRNINKSCAECGGYAGGLIFCSQECSQVSRRKIKDRPSKSDLKKMLSKLSFCAVGRKFGVSDNAVRKWAKGYGLI